MEIRYAIYDPTKNITALVTSPVPRRRQAAVAAMLMARRPSVEQVGFLEAPADHSARFHLQMMGGEFCGNASMSAAAYLAECSALPVGQGADYPLEVSGAGGVLTCHIENAGAFFLGTVTMPVPKAIGCTVLPPMESGRFRSIPAVWFPGIVHCIVPADAMTREEAETELLPRFRGLCDWLSSDACGILLFDEPAAAFTPLVYVASTDTAVWESGCGSGSAAIGAYLASRDRTDCEIALRQPGGIIRVRAAWSGTEITAVSITGRVCRAGGGHMEFDL